MANYLNFSCCKDAKKVWEGMLVNKSFSYEAIIPSPKTKEKCDKFFFVSPDDHITLEANRPWFNWYKWQMENWGVKWDALNPARMGDQIVFCSPWNKPCDKLFQGIANKFGVEFSSYHRYEDGECITEDWKPTKKQSVKILRVE